MLQLYRVIVCCILFVLLTAAGLLNSIVLYKHYQILGGNKPVTAVFSNTTRVV